MRTPPGREELLGGGAAAAQRRRGGGAPDDAPDDAPDRRAAHGERRSLPCYGGHHAVPLRASAARSCGREIPTNARTSRGSPPHDGPKDPFRAFGRSDACGGHGRSDRRSDQCLRASPVRAHAAAISLRASRSPTSRWPSPTTPRGGITGGDPANEATRAAHRPTCWRMASSWRAPARRVSRSRAYRALLRAPPGQVSPTTRASRAWAASGCFRSWSPRRRSARRWPTAPSSSDRRSVSRVPPGQAVFARSFALAMSRSSCFDAGLGDIVRRVEESRGAPVVLEFAGPSARLLSVGERSAVMAALAPQVGAAAALFVSDERTEVFLRDQRRSKAHRALAPRSGRTVRRGRQRRPRRRRSTLAR